MGVELIIFLAIGALAGWLAGIVMNWAAFGVIGNIVIGVIGSFIGGFVGKFIEGAAGFHIPEGSICVSGSYPNSSESKEGSAAFPRFLMLCKHSKKAR
jgi:uncharacterized membrane protein YeaQ/YmgE (transglycosylase-associated protein family)